MRFVQRLDAAAAVRAGLMHREGNRVQLAFENVPSTTTALSSAVLVSLPAGARVGRVEPRGCEVNTLFGRPWIALRRLVPPSTWQRVRVSFRMA